MFVMPVWFWLGITVQPKPLSSSWSTFCQRWGIMVVEHCCLIQ